MHTTDGSFDGTLAWFASPASGVSAHHLVALDGTVAHLVDEDDTAFHAGNEPRPEIPALGDAAPNAVTIGIEMADEGRPFNLGFILVHLLEETARHLGHLDVLRELLDGTTGE